MPILALAGTVSDSTRISSRGRDYPIDSIEAMKIPIKDALTPTTPELHPTPQVIGHSREGREISGYVIGAGALNISLIAGCHADEPVGPAMLTSLVRFLSQLPAEDSLVRRATWYVVPHVNPDGADRNRGWTDKLVETRDSYGQPDVAYDPVYYIESVVREPPGDDIEFGFPRTRDDLRARPENTSVAAFLSKGAPFDLHASFHGMGLAPGPWFLLEPSWIERTDRMRANLRARVREMQLALFDIDRGGEKGFSRIDEGFSTRPDSKAMKRYFLDRDDPETAEKFRPSSMEFVRSLGGDPLTFVSEMPLFILEAGAEDQTVPRFRPGTEGMRQLHAWIEEQILEHGPTEARHRIARAGIRPMPIRDQMRLQIAFLNESLEEVSRDRTHPSR